MLYIKCSNCHEQLAEMFCKNQFCNERRLFCYENCLRTKQKHYDHLKDTEKIETLPNFVKANANECQKMLEEFDISFNEVHGLYRQFQNGLFKKYSLSDRALQQSNSDQINDALCRFINLKKDKEVLLENFQNGINFFIEKLKECIEELKLDELNYLEQLSSEEISIPSMPFQFELIEKSSIKSDIKYCSFAFNNNSSIVIGGLENGEIKIFEFIDELLKQIQLIKNGDYAVYCLQFMQKSNQFISGSADGTINIWSFDDVNQWHFIRKFNEDCGPIMCLITNISENLIFSGNQDSTIKIFDGMQDWNLNQILTGHKGCIVSISLNPQQDMLISCTDDGDQIIIIYQRKNQVWNIFQNIAVGNNGFRLCFINNRRFVFQPLSSEFLEIYENNLSNQLFQKTSELSQQQKKKFICDALFPQQFIQSKSIIINKNGFYVNILRIMTNHEIIHKYQIQFLTEQIYGALNNNGQYLITWDIHSQQIQLRKYIEQKLC